jgi:hypothetical protein
VKSLCCSVEEIETGYDTVLDMVSVNSGTVDLLDNFYEISVIIGQCSSLTSKQKDYFR